MPVVQSGQWEPTVDNKWNLGAADRRWANLFLAGTIKGQETAPSSAVTFELNGITGNFDTTGDINALNATFQGDVNIGGDLNFVDASNNPTGSWDNDANRICLGFNCQMFYDWNGNAGIVGTR